MRRRCFFSAAHLASLSISKPYSIKTIKTIISDPGRKLIWALVDQPRIWFEDKTIVDLSVAA